MFCGFFLALVAIGLFALPQLYAQDTTITIYGKKFAPGVIVKINGRLVDSANIRRDSAQPSRILYVKFRLDWLNKPPETLLAGGKDAGASLTSNEVGNIVEVGNPPGTEMASSTIYTRPASPRIWITQANTTDSLRSLRLRLPLNSRRDTLIRLNFPKVPIGTAITLQLSDSSRFALYDSTNTNQLWSLTTVANSSTYPFTIRYNAPSALLQGNGKERVTLNLIGRQNNKIIVQRSFPLEGIPIQTIQIIAAFTASVANKPYYDTMLVKKNNKSREQEDIEKTVSNPQQLMKNYLQVFNTYLAKLDSSGSTDKIARTQFVFTEEPFQIQYQEQSSNTNIFADLDALQGNDTQESPTGRSGMQEISTKQTASNFPTVLLVNSETVPYRAITSSCQTNRIPKYILVEIKYLNSFLSINYLDKKFFDALAAIINP